MPFSIMSSCLRFLVEKKEEFGELSVADKSENDRIRGHVMYRMYAVWCSHNHERVKSQAKFGREIKPHVEKMKSNGVVYFLSTIEV